MDGVGTVGREVNGDPFSTGVKHGDGGGGGEEGERNRLWTSKYDKQVSQSVGRARRKAVNAVHPLWGMGDLPKRYPRNETSNSGWGSRFCSGQIVSESSFSVPQNQNVLPIEGWRGPVGQCVS